MHYVRLVLLLLAGLVGAVETAHAAETVTLRLRFEGRTLDAPLVAIEHAQRSDRTAIPLPLDPVETERNWWLQGFDAKGRELYRLPVRNPQLRRMEAFDPRTGKILDVRDVRMPQGSFDVSFPYDARVARVSLRASDLSGKGRWMSSMPLVEIERPWLDRRLRAGNLKPTAKTAATTLIDNGAAAKRLDLVFVGDGYTVDEMSKWQADAAGVVNGLMSDPLFRVYRQRINIRRVDVESAQSGVDEPDKGIFRDTAMDAAFNCANIDRLLCANTTKVLSTVGSVLEPDARDVVVVVANSTRYGGSGGSIAAISMHSAAIELALHELGHTLFGLADEYDYGTCILIVEPSARNVSLVASRDVKWGEMISRFTTVPTATGQYPNGTVGVFQGGQYCASGKYRATEDSKMRTLGRPWHIVNEIAASQVFALYSRDIEKLRIQIPLRPNATAVPSRTGPIPGAATRPVSNRASGARMPRP